jgi:hypothetical protein
LIEESEVRVTGAVPEVRPAMLEFVGQYLADYEQAASAHGLTLAQARVLGFAATMSMSNARSRSGSAATRPTSAARSTGWSSSGWSNVGRQRPTPGSN